MEGTMIRNRWYGAGPRKKMVGLRVLVALVGLTVSGIAQAEEPAGNWTSKLFANNDGAYNGGRGLITASGPTGMFLNPTSGTLGKGQLSVQVFGSTIKPISALPNAGRDQFAYYNSMVSYGVTDWLEVGGLAQLLDRSNNGDQQSVAAGGAFVRARVIKDQGFLPEVSVGGMFFEGNQLLDRRTLFLAMSKRVAISETGPIRGLRFHLGGRTFWQNTSAGTTAPPWVSYRQRENNSSVGYIGAEIELPKHLYLVGELQSRESGDQRQPFSLGLQFRHPEGFGLSVALLRPGLQEGMTAYVGVGINFY
jgi:hypothetical protein